MNVAETVKAAQNGDKNAVEELYKNYIKEIKTIAKCYFPNEDDAEDAASEIFLLVMQKIGTIENPAAFHGWLRKVIQHKCISILRKKREFTMNNEEYIENRYNTDMGNFSEVVPHEKLDNTETQKMIYNIVSELPEKHKSVILMYYYSDMSVESIAKALDISEGTVKSRLSHARDKIEKKIRVYEKKGIKLYSVDILKSLGQIISNISQNTQVTTNFSTVMNSFANSSSTLTSAVSTITTAQVSNIVSTSVARTVSNATATRISVIASAATIAVCTTVAQLPPTDAQIPAEIEVPVIKESIVYVPSEVVSTIHDTSVIETTIVETSTIYDTSIIHDVSTIYDTSIIHDISTIYDTSVIHDVSTIYDTSVIHDTSTVYETSMIENTVYVETEKPSAPKDHSISHYEEDEIFRYKVYDNANEATLVSVAKVPQEVMETLEIPQEINGIPVTAIGHHALKNQQFFENVKIGGNIQEIENSAFEKSGLQSIELNNYIRKIAPYTFSECKNLETVTNTENVEYVEYNAFEGTNLKKIDFPHLLSVNFYAFSCSSVPDIVIPACIENIDEYSFRETCDNLTVYLDMNHVHEFPEVYEQLEKLVENALNVNIIFPDGITEITGNEDESDFLLGDSFFEKELSWFYIGQSLTITLPDSVEKIGDKAFCNVNTLEHISMPPNLTEIGKYAFTACTSLKEIDLPQGLEKIGDFAFEFCDSLEKAVIPESVVYIGEDCFDSQTVIYGVQGSYAQQYAEEYELKFVPVEAESDTSGETGDFSSL